MFTRKLHYDNYRESFDSYKREDLESPWIYDGTYETELTAEQVNRLFNEGNPMGGIDKIYTFSDDGKTYYRMISESPSKLSKSVRIIRPIIK